MALVALVATSVRAQDAQQSASGQLTRICDEIAPKSNGHYACTCMPLRNFDGRYPSPVQQKPKNTPIFVQQAGEQPQLVGQQGNNGGPIVIQLKPQDITVNQQAAPAPPQPPPIAAQGLTPPAAPKAPAEDDLESLVFSGPDEKLLTRCPKDSPLTWTTNRFGKDGIRDYYEEHGNGGHNIDTCQDECKKKEECFAAIVTPSNRCYFLTTTNPLVCHYNLKGHFGAVREKCTPQKPCPVVYKQCGKPKCGLRSIITTYCSTQSKSSAVRRCTLG